MLLGQGIIDAFGLRLSQQRSPLRVFIALVRYLEKLHGVYECVDGRVEVFVDEGSEVETIVVRVATSVNDTHLFDKGALPRFTST